jgi:hypothetical protein
MLADLDDRLDQPVQRGLRQPGGVAGPLVLGDGVQEEAFLIALADLGGLSPLQRDDIGQARLSGRWHRIAEFAVGTGRRHHGQQATTGISHEP